MAPGKLVPIFMIIGVLAPIASIVAAVIFYGQYSSRVGRENRIPVFAYIAAVAVCGAVGGYLGLTIGIARACDGPNAGNLCGLWGFFVTGPISCAVAVVAVSLVCTTARARP